MALPRSPQHMKHNPAAVIPVGGGVEESSSCESEPKSSLMVPLVAATGGDPTVVEALAPPSWLLRSRKLSRDRPLSSSTATDKTSMTKSKRGISLGLLKRICFCGNASSSSSSNISSSTSNISGGTSGSSKCKCKYPRNIVQSTLSFMHFLGRVLMWSSVAATAAGVVWYSRELSVNGYVSYIITSLRYVSPCSLGYWHVYISKQTHSSSGSHASHFFSSLFLFEKRFVLDYRIVWSFYHVCVCGKGRIRI
jgi:hypothetical protein